MYKLNKNFRTGEITSVTKTANGFAVDIPFDPANTDYQAYLKWLEESPDNVPLPADE